MKGNGQNGSEGEKARSPRPCQRTSGRMRVVFGFRRAGGRRGIWNEFGVGIARENTDNDASSNNSSVNIVANDGGDEDDSGGEAPIEQLAMT